MGVIGSNFGNNMVVIESVLNLVDVYVVVKVMDKIKNCEIKIGGQFKVQYKVQYDY